MRIEAEAEIVNAKLRAEAASIEHLAALEKLTAVCMDLSAAATY